MTDAAVKAADIPSLSAIDQVKLTLMAGISQRIVATYGNFYRASVPTNQSHRRLIALKSRHYQEFSLPWLIQFADQLGAKITITIE